ncbi:MAG TPA: hydrogenase maturation protease [Casimicrobiaceae bacterium]|nr:hydrogenase maturation protease [Casimicrobiaceae bacterium]
MRRARIVVVACGNESRGDDALGPAFVERAQGRPDPPGVTTTFVADYQLQPEHALDLAGQDLALFVDAGVDVQGPCELAEVAPAAAPTFSTHGMTPGAVLEAYRRATGRAPPPAFALAIRGVRFRLGDPLSTPARTALDAAFDLFERLRRNATPGAWRAVARPPRKETTCAS